ncbi:hypothetical protein R6Q57_004909 [Mikania cordata]
MFAAVLFIFPYIRRYLESSDHIFFMFMRWWSQPRLYVGAKMHENTFSVVKYTTFWILLIITKLAFSYYLEIKPLISPTKAVMSEYSYTWHSFISPARNNIGVVVTLWAPIILVYFMDTQIWYAIFSTIFGGVYGAFNRLGEIQNLGTLRSRFLLLPGAINCCLIPPEKRKKGLATSLSRNFSTLPSNKEKEAARFAQIWNKIITSFRGEDLINNREMNLLLAPQFVDRELDLIQWPLFLLAGKIPVALDIVTSSHGFAHELKKKMENDKYMSCAVRECYASFRFIIEILVQGKREKKIIYSIFSETDAHIEGGSLVTACNLSAFPTLYGHIVEFIKCLLENNRKDQDQVVILFQDMLEVILRDMMINELTILQEPPFVELGQQYYPLFAPAGAILSPAPSSEAWKERINRLYLLLTVRDSAMYIPSNIEARRRLSFFSNSLFMNMPSAPKVRNMLSFSILTPHDSEDVLFPLDLLEKQNEDGISMISYLQKIFSDEWANFLERKRCYSMNDLVGNEDLEDDLCHWASYRGQTLARTVRGMMYYRQALELQSFLDIAEDEDLMEGYKSTELRENSLLAQCQAVADMKFTYVVSCHNYGIQKKSGDPRARDVLKLLSKYPSLRVACIDEVEENSKDANNRMSINKVYYSTLVKAVPSSSETGQIWDQVIYRIKLPGPVKLGEGRSENQNHAIIFTRGEGLQTIDTNQDNYMEEAFKMRNLLHEFLKKHDDGKYPTILGVREHIFTENVSSLARFMSNQETSFVTIGRRLMANPLKVRFHYGHPDVFDRLFHITRGGVSKASRIINLSGDIFAGFNSTLRDGKVTHHDYVQVGKGWDASLNQISLFEAKMADGNGEQTLSRDLYRLGHNFDFFRMLSCYFTTIGFYFNTLISVFIVYLLLYGRLYLVLSGHEELKNQPAILNNQSLQVVFASHSFVQIGFLVALPMMMEIGLERGFLTALSEFISMLINLAPMFFTFLLGTKSHYYGRTLLHGGAKYTTTGRGFVVFHTKFTDNYRFYSRSHFVKGIELLNLLIVNQLFSKSIKGVPTNILITVSIWFLVITWLFAPFVFNPLGFEWQKIVDDWADWNKWISNQGGIGVPLEKSWESWWEEEQEHLSYSGKRGVILEILLAFRFLIYHFWLVNHSDMSKHVMSSLQVYGILFGIFVVVKALWLVRERFGENFQLLFGLIKAVIMFVSVFMILKAVSYMTLQDIVVCFLAFVPAGWGLLLIAQACKPVVKMAGLWELVRAVARGYEIVMGLIVFTPVALIARLPFVSEFQTHMLFCQAFNRGLPMSRILNGRRKDSSARDD